MSLIRTLQFSAIFLFTMCTYDNAASQEKESDYSPITIQGEEYPNSCTDDQKNILKNTLHKEKIPKPEEVWSIVDLILCAPLSKVNRSKISQVLPAKVMLEAEGTGETEVLKQPVKVDADFIEGLFAQGKAWQAGFVVLHNTLKLQYAENEACIEERTMKFSKGRWKIVAIGQACD